MINVAWVRGAYLNNFEGQNYCMYDAQIKITGFASYHTIHDKLPFPIIRFLSLHDINILGRLGKIFFNRILGDIQNLYGLEKYAQDYDIFHTADPHYFYSYQLAQLKLQNKIKKLLVTSWETIPFNNEKVWAKKRIKTITRNAADHFLCYTKKAKESLITEGVNPNKISLIPLGVNLRYFKPKRKNDKNITVLCVARLVEEKGIMDAYNVFKRVKLQIENNTLQKNKLWLKMNFIGKGPLYKKLLNQIKKDNLSSSVKILTMAYEQMPGAYQKADIFLLPSKKTKTWEEQYGMSYIEAMATGLPIVAYDTGAVKEVVSNAGLIAPEGDIHILTKYVYNLVTDISLRKKIGTIGLQKAQNTFDAKKTAIQIASLYKSLCR